MKKTILGISLFLLFSLNSIAQSYDKQCYYGISFEKSENRNWGYGELIITDVEPNSPAETAGIKVNDIIMEINGKATYLRDNVTIAEWLFDNPNPVVKFTIRNIDTYFKEYILNRECITVNSVDENYLATIFSFYSLEDTRQQSFKLPLEIKPLESNPEIEANYTDFHTFNFYDADKTDLPQIDGTIKAILEKELIAKGLTKDLDNPDIWINLYYAYAANPQFTGLGNLNQTSTAARYNSHTKQMETLPILERHVSDYTQKGQYIAELGFTFFDKKYIDSTKFTPIWECSLKDYLSNNYSLEKYAQLHIPLMMMQYPYSNTQNESEYFVSFNKYNYTGLHYDADKMNLINDVDPDSPAFQAGLRAGYTINKINGRNFDANKDAITESYRKFIEDTKKYRDLNTKFVGVEGYTDCMFWDTTYYADIAKQFKKAEYKTNFSYLYDFAKYVNPSYNGSMTIEAWDGMQNEFSILDLKLESLSQSKLFE